MTSFLWIPSVIIYRVTLMWDSSTWLESLKCITRKTNYDLNGLFCGIQMCSHVEILVGTHILGKKTSQVNI